MKTWHWILLGLVTVLALIGEFWGPHDPDHVDHWWSNVPAFYAIFGFIGCIAIIFFSKALGKMLLQRREGYYDAD